MRAVLVLPVRLAVGSRVVQTTTRTVSPAAIFVRCVAPPGPGTPVGLRLYLPDGPPEDLSGVVVAAPGETGPGCQVELLRLGDAQRERLVRVTAPPVLHRTPMAGVRPVVPGRPLGGGVIVPPPPPERQPAPPAERAPATDQRALARVPVSLRVRFDSIEAMAEQLAVNLSAGGMFVRCDPAPPVGTEVALSIELPAGEPPLLCCAVVAHRMAREEARQRGQPPGVGLQFLDADDRFRQQIDELLARAQGLTPLDE